MSAHVMTIRSPEQQAEFKRLESVLADTLGLDWKATAGQPDGWEIAEDCAEALWHVGFRIHPNAAPPAREVEPEAADVAEMEASV